MSIINTAAACLYLASSALLILFLARARPAGWIRRAGFASGLAGFAAHTAALAVAVAGGEPLAGGIARGVFVFSWLTAAALLALGGETRRSSLGAFVFTLAFAAVLPSAVPVSETAARSALPLVEIHVALALSGQAFFFIAFVAAVLYLIRERRIKRGSLSADKGGSLLPITGLDRVQHICLLCGFPPATLGLALGFVSASRVWGADWEWGGKVALSVVTWVIYAVLINGRFAHGWKGRKSALVAIAGFVAIAAVFVASYRL